MRKAPLVQALSLSFFFHAICVLSMALGLRACSQKSVPPTEVSLASIQVQNTQNAKRAQAAGPVQDKEPISAPPAQLPAKESAESPASTDHSGAKTSSQNEKAIDTYALQVREKILSFQHYPQSAKNRKQEGTVILNFKLGTAGELLDLSFETTDAVQALIEAAQDAVKDSSPFGPLPKDHASAFRIAIQFKLQNL